MLKNIKELIDGVRMARKARGLSQQGLAQKVGMPQSHISKIEAGKVSIELSSFVEMARTLELELMLIPRQSVSVIKNLITPKKAQRQEDEIGPAYPLDDDEEEEETNA